MKYLVLTTVLIGAIGGVNASSLDEESKGAVVEIGPEDPEYWLIAGADYKKLSVLGVKERRR